jgi:hypothetical protein
MACSFKTLAIVDRAVSQVLQRTLETCVAPARVFSGHSHDELANLPHNPGPSRPPAGVRPFSNDKLPVPPQDRVWRHQAGDLPQEATPETIAAIGIRPTRPPIEN